MKSATACLLLISLLILGGCLPKKEVTEDKDTSVREVAETAAVTPDESKEAEKALINFFDNLARQDYQNALNYYEPEEGLPDSWENYKVYVADKSDDKAKLLRQYCETMQTCERVEPLRLEGSLAHEYEFEVQFKKGSGEVMELGPCCGETNPPETKFIYRVKKFGDTYKVTTAPLYHP